MKTQTPVEASSKALDQIMKYLTKGPVLFLIGVFLAGNIISVIFIVKFLLDSRDRENKINERMFEMINSNLEIKMKPLEKRVIGTLTNVDSSLTKVDSVLTRNTKNEK